MVPLPHAIADAPLLMAHVVALVTPVQVRVDVPPAVIVGGVAVNAPTVGAALTVTVAVAVTLPPGPVAVSV